MFTIEFIEDNTGELTRQALDEGYQAVGAALGPEGVKALVEERNTAQAEIRLWKKRSAENEIAACAAIERAEELEAQLAKANEKRDRLYNALEPVYRHQKPGAIIVELSKGEWISVRAALGEIEQPGPDSPWQTFPQLLQSVSEARSRAEKAEAQLAEAGARTGDCLNCGRRLPPDGDCYGCAADTTWAEIAGLQTQLAAKEVTIADLHELAYERQPKLAADELRKQKEEFEAQLAEAKKKAREIELLFNATLRDIHDEAELALGYPQVCDAQTAVRRLIIRSIADTARAENAEAQAATFKAALESLWIEHPLDSAMPPECAWCSGFKSKGHVPDCVIGLALEPKDGETTFTDGHLFTFTTGDEPGIEYVRKNSRIGFVWGEEPSWFVVAPDGQSASGYLDARFDVDELRRALAAFGAPKENGEGVKE